MKKLLFVLLFGFIFADYTIYQFYEEDGKYSAKMWEVQEKPIKKGEDLIFYQRDLRTSKNTIIIIQEPYLIEEQ